MLGNSRVDPVLLATNLAKPREFYHDEVGLEIIAGTADSQTQIGWEVDDLRAELGVPPRKHDEGRDLPGPRRLRFPPE